jgi:polyferredoxin
VDCGQCVAVCPTGYDIRNGPDIACITCALCIDACDRVMKEVGRPRGLIDYATLEDCEAERKGAEPKPAWKSILHVRTIVYLGIWSAIGIGLLFALGNRARTDIAVQPDRSPPYMTMSDGSVRNSYTVKLRNMENRPRDMEITLVGLPDGAMWTEEMNSTDATRSLIHAVPADATEALRVYVVAPRGTQSQEFTLAVKALDERGETDSENVGFNGPGG